MIKEYKNTGYKVSSTGIIYSKYSGGKPRTYSLDRYGYYKCPLTVNGKTLHLTVHRIVAETFIPNPNNLPQVNHIDGNKLNNDVSNLEWCTAQQNSTHKKIMNLTAKGERNGNAKYTSDQIHKVCKMLEDGYRDKEIREELGLDKNIIQKIKNGDCWVSISSKYDIKRIPQQGIGMGTFLWVCHKLEEGLSYKEILSMYSGGEYLTYSCLKKIKARKMRPEHSKNFNF
jgi:hypothetical protein